MTITVEFDFDKSGFTNFTELERKIWRFVLEIGRILLRRILEVWDEELFNSRERSRYASHGKRKTCLKTLVGDVEYERTVYVDKGVEGRNACVFLLDEALGIETVGLVTPAVCEVIANTICETTYRETSRMLKETTGLSISPQGVWNIVQDLGETRREQVGRYSDLRRERRSTGMISTKLLYEEDDGIWLSLQGRDRKEYGPGKELKVGIAYDGVLWSGGKSGKARRTLHNKVAYTSFESAEEYREHKEGLIASRFDVEGIQMRIRNGDGAGWLRGFRNADVNVLDEFHRNKAVTTSVRNPEFRTELMKRLHDKDVPGVFEYLEAMINSEDDPDAVKNYIDLQDYFMNNKDGLLGVYDRGLDIPKTSQPGTIHHARLGSMESNVFTLVGNRMKGRRANWSVKGAANLANLLCLYHTTGLSGMFTGLSEPLSETVPVMERKPLSASAVPTKTGKGHECWRRTTVPNVPWLKSITGFQSLTDLRLS